MNTVVDRVTVVASITVVGAVRNARITTRIAIKTVTIGAVTCIASGHVVYHHVNKNPENAIIMIAEGHFI